MVDRNRLRFPSRLITYKYLLIGAGVVGAGVVGAGVVGAGVVGDGGRIKPHFFILFSELGSIQFLFLSKIVICLWPYA